MEVRQVDAKQGWQWIVTGFFTIPPGSTGLDFTMHHLASYCRHAVAHPHGGAIYFHPPVTRVSSRTDDRMQRLEQGGKLEMAHLLAGFSNTSGPLITIGEFIW